MPVKAETFRLWTYCTILLFFWPWRKICTSYLSSESRPRILPFKSQRTSVWNKRASWSAPKYTQRAAKSLVFKALFFTKLATFIVKFSELRRSSGRKVLAEKACLWLTQWVPVMAWFYYLANGMHLEREASIAEATSMQRPTSFSHERPFSWKKKFALSMGINGTLNRPMSYLKIAWIRRNVQYKFRQADETRWTCAASHTQCYTEEPQPHVSAYNGESTLHELQK